MIKKKEKIKMNLNTINFEFKVYKIGKILKNMNL